MPSVYGHRQREMLIHRAGRASRCQREQVTSSCGCEEMSGRRYDPSAVVFPMTSADLNIERIRAVGDCIDANSWLVRRWVRVMPKVLLAF